MVSFRQKETNDGRTTWIIQRNEKKISFLLKTNKNEWLHIIRLNELFYWKNDLIERTILLNERFYWKNDFTKQTILLKDRSVRKQTKSMLLTIEKTSDELGPSRTIKSKWKIHLHVKKN